MCVCRVAFEFCGCVRVCVCVSSCFQILRWMRLLCFDFFCDCVHVGVLSCFLVLRGKWPHFISFFWSLCACVYVCQDGFHMYMCMYTFMLVFNNQVTKRTCTYMFTYMQHTATTSTAFSNQILQFQNLTSSFPNKF